jgi:hypothetical protein
MLSQNSIPTRTPQATELVAGTHALIAELQERLSAGQSFDNPKLTEIADKSFSGTRAQGRYTSRDAYDALEIAVNKYLDTQARELLQMEVSDALASVLRPLTKRLARQCDRTLEQTELQQFSTPPTLAYLAARILDGYIVDESHKATHALQGRVWRTDANRSSGDRSTRC